MKRGSKLMGYRPSAGSSGSILTVSHSNTCGALYRKPQNAFFARFCGVFSYLTEVLWYQDGTCFHLAACDFVRSRRCQQHSTSSRRRRAAKKCISSCPLASPYVSVANITENT